jgi:benzoylformate decarboxylase
MAGTVREATFDVLRDLGLTTLYANPGSTEVPFLAGLPGDLRFVLALHEASVVGMATGEALARDRPALVNLHTVAGLGNAVGALATARQNRAPLVVVVGSQDRRHLAMEPFLAGRLDDLAGSYPVWVGQPARPQDVPGAIARAFHESQGPRRGPALVIVPMDDWLAPWDGSETIPAPGELVRAAGADAGAVAMVAERIDQAARVAMVTGAGADGAARWAAVTALAERLGCPVWQEPFGARAGFPQDHPRFAGHLPAARGRLRETLAGYDLVVVAGAPVLRQYPYEPGPLVPEGTGVIQLTEDPAEAARAPAALAVVTPLAPFVTELAGRVRAREAEGPARATPAPPAPDPARALRPDDVFTLLAARLPADAVVVEESPSSRFRLEALVPARAPLGFLSAAGGGLGFAMPAAIGVRMAEPGRPVVCVVGDGSSLYAIQSLWSAARYGAGVLFLVMANGGYAIMDRLAEAHDPAAKPPWPSFGEVDIATLAAGFGCPARRVAGAADLTAALDEVVPGLATRAEPLVLVVEVEPDPTFTP